MRPEHAIQRAILDAARWRKDVLLWRQNTGAVHLPGERGRNDRFVKFGIKGAADITGILRDGRRIEIEVKTPKGKLTAHQRAYGERILAMGGVWFVARSVDEALIGIKRAFEK